ncbi:MAG: succinate CoA transferase [Planctomycetes bacterium]|nr:succinate CoA transferase [Planctomycetota bacterium]
MAPHRFATLTADEAAALIPDGALVGFSGFTPAGSAKAVPRALTARARALHARGESYRLRVLAGASTGKALDEELAGADAIAWRAPYQSSPALRAQVNAGRARFVDMHLSSVPQMVAAGEFGPLDVAVVECTEVTPDGRVYLTSSVGASPTWLQCAQRVVLEVNRWHAPRLRELTDVVVLPPPHHRSPIAIAHPMDRIGWPYAAVDPRKVVGVVETDEPDGVPAFDATDGTSERIAGHVVRFLLGELRAGRIPREFLPVQAGVGNVANAVLRALGSDPDVPPFWMYSEVLQDAVLELMDEGKILGASTTALTLTDPAMARLSSDLDRYASRVVLRPQEVSNHPEVIRRLALISLNAALEVDVYGHVNSTHVAGTQLVNGIGGSGDFARNAAVPIFVAPSTAKGGRISTIVPMCSHVDHNEHSTRVIVTEQGLADLRGLGPDERAAAIIESCAHPAYRDYLLRYLERARVGHLRHDLRTCFELHLNLVEHGAMLPGLRVE